MRRVTLLIVYFANRKYVTTHYGYYMQAVYVLSRHQLYRRRNHEHRPRTRGIVRATNRIIRGREDTRAFVDTHANQKYYTSRRPALVVEELRTGKATRKRSV